MDHQQVAHADHGREARAQFERPDYVAYLEQLREATVEIVESVLRTANFTEEDFACSSRVKSAASFERKAGCAKPDEPSSPKYRNPLEAIDDQVGVRVRVLHAGELNNAADLIEAHPGLDVCARDNKSKERARRGSFGYGGIHLLVRPVRHIMPPDSGKKLEKVEIQLRSHAQHAWAEVEHRLRYKTATTESNVSRQLDRAAALMETADEILAGLADNNQIGQEREPVPEPVVAERVSLEWLERRFPDAKPPTAPALAWIARCASTLGLGDARELGDRLDAVDLPAVQRVFEEVGHSPRSQVRQLDDALLWLGRDDYIAAAERGVDGTSDRYAAGRPGILRWRLERMRKAGLLTGDSSTGSVARTATSNE